MRGHYYTYHIHIETGENDSMNLLNNIEVTDEYSDCTSALQYALSRLQVRNDWEFFPEIEQLTLSLE